MAIIGAIAFGIIIGYLSWHAIRLMEKAITLRTVAAFIGVVAGAAITTLFPSSSEMFAGYCLGLAIGFFFTPLKQWVAGYFVSKKEQETFEKVIRVSRFLKEKEEVKKEWPTIEQLVKHKIDAKGYLTMFDLGELQYDNLTKVFILQEYARLHYDTGVHFSEISLELVKDR